MDLTDILEGESAMLADVHGYLDFSFNFGCAARVGSGEQGLSSCWDLVALQHVEL